MLMSDNDEQTKDDDMKNIFVVQYLNKQTTALREVNDSRLRIYEQVFIIIIIFILIIYKQNFANIDYHLTDPKISLMLQYLHFIYLQPKIFGCK